MQLRSYIHVASYLPSSPWYVTNFTVNEMVLALASMHICALLKIGIIKNSPYHTFLTSVCTRYLQRHAITKLVSVHEREVLSLLIIVES